MSDKKSEKSFPDVSVCNFFGKAEYKYDNNPRRVWEAIGAIGESGQKEEYPEWVRKYLEDTAKALLMKCDGKATGKNGVVACLGFHSLSQLKVINDPIEQFLIYSLMKKKVADGLTVKEAAIAVEYERLAPIQPFKDKQVDYEGRKEGTKVYWGVARIIWVYEAMSERLRLNPIDKEEGDNEANGE